MYKKKLLFQKSGFIKKVLVYKLYYNYIALIIKTY